MTERVFSERYRVTRHLARGGMAEVYLAHDLLLDRPVALKALFPELAADRSFVERFRREARAAANLNHPGIVAVYDWGEDEGSYFIVMEYVEGRTLRDLILTEAPLRPERAAEIASEIATALAFAHRRGVIHRDVKPGNVIISPTGQVKVTDFGIARAGNPEEALTQTGAVMGTATYFSPEQAQGRSIDPRSDVYSLGVVLYEMVAGRPPFSGDSPVSIAYQHVRETPPPPSRHNPDLPAALEAVVLKAMAKNPADRYPSAEELAADLARFRQGRPVSAGAPVVDPDATAVVAGAAASTSVRAEDPALTATRVEPGGATRVAPAAVVVEEEEEEERRARRPPWVWLAALAGLLVLTLALIALMSGRRVQAEAEVPAVVSRSLTDARAVLEASGLQGEPSPPGADPAGRVVDQSPEPGTRLPRGSVVTLVVAAPVTTAPPRPTTTRPRPRPTAPRLTSPPPPPPPPDTEPAPPTTEVEVTSPPRTRATFPPLRTTPLTTSR